MKHKRSIKNLLTLAFAVVLALCMQATAFAANPQQVLTVDTTLNVVVQESEDYTNYVTDVSAEQQWAWHPISVVNEPMNGFNAVRRTYALPPDINPAVISTDNFVMFGQQFTFAYVLQQPTSNEAFMEMRETVTIDTRSRNLNDILPNLEQEIWFERDGFAGTLVLDIHSITSETAGVSRHTSTAIRQRTFPHLSSPDNSFIPRTITDGGTTFHLSTVNWTSSSVSAVDGHPVSSSYTAHATFTAQVTQTRATGYTTTAEYIGTVFRITQGMTLFTAIFYGEPIIEIWLDEPKEEVSVVIPIEPETVPEPTSVPALVQSTESRGNAGNAIIIAFAVISALIGFSAVGVGAFFLAKHFLGYNVTVYSINGPRDIVKAGKIKVDLNSPEPTIIFKKAGKDRPHRKAKADSSRFAIGFLLEI